MNAAKRQHGTLNEVCIYRKERGRSHGASCAPHADGSPREGNMVCGCLPATMRTALLASPDTHTHTHTNTHTHVITRKCYHTHTLTNALRFCARNDRRLFIGSAGQPGRCSQKNEHTAHTTHTHDTHLPGAPPSLLCFLLGGRAGGAARLQSDLEHGVLLPPRGPSLRRQRRGQKKGGQTWHESHKNKKFVRSFCESECCSLVYPSARKVHTKVPVRPLPPRLDTTAGFLRGEAASPHGAL